MCVFYTLLLPAYSDHGAGSLTVWFSHSWYLEGACLALPIWALLSLSHTSTHISAQKFPSPRWEGSTCMNLVLLKTTLVFVLCTPFSFFYLLLLAWRSLRNVFCFLYLSSLCVLWSSVSFVKLFHTLLLWILQWVWFTKETTVYC